jgi:hypothetical protein
LCGKWQQANSLFDSQAICRPLLILLYSIFDFFTLKEQKVVGADRKNADSMQAGGVMVDSLSPNTPNRPNTLYPVIPVLPLYGAPNRAVTLICFSYKIEVSLCE